MGYLQFLGERLEVFHSEAVPLAAAEDGMRWKTRGRNTHMNRPGKPVAWICLFSVLSMGCYSSALIDPKGDERDKMYSGEIEYVVMKDSTKYMFDRTPEIVKDSIVGTAQCRQVSLPLVDVASAGIREMDWTATALAVGVTGAVAVAASIHLGKVYSRGGFIHPQ
jgi:hypothetical protein